MLSHLKFILYTYLLLYQIKKFKLLLLKEKTNVIVEIHKLCKITIIQLNISLK